MNQVIAFKSFAATPRMMPPPPRPPRFGGRSECWKARVEVYGDLDRLGAFIGYDITPRISEATRDACIASKMGTCSQAVLTMLPYSDKPCGGHVFVFDASNTVKRVIFV